MSEIKETVSYDSMDDRLIIKTSYDAQPVIELNHSIKAALRAKAIQKYKPQVAGMVKAATLHEGDVVRLKNMGYNLLSPDPQEYRRALLYIQRNEPHLLSVHGKPFAKSRVKWQ